MTRLQAELSAARALASHLRSSIDRRLAWTFRLRDGITGDLLRAYEAARDGGESEAATPAADPRLVYIAGPFSGPTREHVEENIRVAVRWGIEVAKLGAFPVIPHANTSHPDFETVQPYPFWIAGTLALLRPCHAVFLVPGWERSSGARGERLDALERGVPVFDSLDALRAWLELTGPRAEELGNG